MCKAICNLFQKITQGTDWVKKGIEVWIIGKMTIDDAASYWGGFLCRNEAGAMQRQQCFGKRSNVSSNLQKLCAVKAI